MWHDEVKSATSQYFKHLDAKFYEMGVESSYKLSESCRWLCWKIVVSFPYLIRFEYDRLRVRFLLDTRTLLFKRTSYYFLFQTWTSEFTYFLADELSKMQHYWYSDSPCFSYKIHNWCNEASLISYSLN